MNKKQNYYYCENGKKLLSCPSDRRPLAIFWKNVERFQKCPGLGKTTIEKTKYGMVATFHLPHKKKITISVE